jgi:hypothetical protein
MFLPNKPNSNAQKAKKKSKNNTNSGRTGLQIMAVHRIVAINEKDTRINLTGMPLYLPMLKF